MQFTFELKQNVVMKSDYFKFAIMYVNLCIWFGNKNSIRYGKHQTNYYNQSPFI